MVLLVERNFMALNKTTTNLTEKELRSLMDKFDSKRKGRIDYKAFIKFASPKDSDLSNLEKLIRNRVRDVARVRGGLQTLDMVAPFENKDVNGNGKITIDEFRMHKRKPWIGYNGSRIQIAVHDSTMVMVILITNHLQVTQLDDKETMEMCRQLKKRKMLPEEIYVRDLLQNMTIIKSGRITKLVRRALVTKAYVSKDERLES